MPTPSPTSCAASRRMKRPTRRSAPSAAREIARKDTEKLLSRTESGVKPKKEYVPLKDAQPGQEVVIAELNQLATVLSRPGRDGMVEVRAGIMKTKVPLSGLRAPDKMEKAPKQRQPVRAHTTVQLDHDRKASMELNLLGYTVEEALAETDKFIDNAVLRGRIPSTSFTAREPVHCAPPSRSICAPTRASRASGWAATARARPA